MIGAALTYRWFIAPSTSVPQRADAVAVLAGGDGERLDRALGLMELGVSEVLILNEGVDWFGPESQPTHDLCRTGSSDFEVVCVRALPDSTRGEAITVAELARQRGYSSLVLVTTDHHLTRSARWLRRCFDGTVHAVAAPAETTRDVIQHEWLSTLAQYTFDRSCEAGDATEF